MARREQRGLCPEVVQSNNEERGSTARLPGFESAAHQACGQYIPSCASVSPHVRMLMSTAPHILFEAFRMVSGTNSSTLKMLVLGRRKN